MKETLQVVQVSCTVRHHRLCVHMVLLEMHCDLPLQFSHPYGAYLTGHPVKVSWLLQGITNINDLFKKMWPSTPPPSLKLFMNIATAHLSLCATVLVHTTLYSYNSVVQAWLRMMFMVFSQLLSILSPWKLFCKRSIGQKIWFAFHIWYKSGYKYFSEPWIPFSGLFLFPYLVTDYGVSGFETDGPIFHSQSTFNILLDACHFIFKVAHGCQQS